MKGRSISILGIFAAFVGIVFIILHNAMSVGSLSIIMGIIFMAVGLINLIFFSSINPENSGARVMSMVSNAGSIVLGISMLVYTDVFSGMISFMLGLLVAVCALWQFFMLAIGARPYQLPVWLYIFPVILLGGAVTIYIMNARDNEYAMLLVTGISLVVLGAGCILEGSILGIARRRDREQHNKDITTETTLAEETKAPQHTPKKVKVETTENLDDE